MSGAFLSLTARYGWVVLRPNPRPQGSPTFLTVPGYWAIPESAVLDRRDLPPRSSPGGDLGEHPGASGAWQSVQQRTGSGPGWARFPGAPSA